MEATKEPHWKQWKSYVGMFKDKGISEHFKTLCHMVYRPQLVFLMKTKFNHRSCHKDKRETNVENSLEVPSSGKSGRKMLLWSRKWCRCSNLLLLNEPHWCDCQGGNDYLESFWYVWVITPKLCYIASLMSRSLLDLMCLLMILQILSI